MKEMYGKRVGVVFFRRERKIHDYFHYEIKELTTPTKSGGTHAVVDLLGEPLMLLKDTGDGLKVVFQSITGDVEDIILD